MWKVLMKGVDLGEPTSFLDHVYLGCAQRECETSKDVVDNYRDLFESRISAGAKEKIPCVQENLTQTSLHGPLIRKVMQRNVSSDTANWQIKKAEQLCKVSTPCLDGHQFKKEKLGFAGGVSKVCSQIVLTCLYLARIGRPDILWSGNKFARAVTKWSRACDKRLARCISFFHHTSEYRQYCYVGYTSTTMQTWIILRLRFCRRS